MVALKKHTERKYNEQPNIIVGIHNYCDRWCERCPFTQRCTVFLAESALSDAEKNPNHEAFWDNLRTLFKDAILNLRQFAQTRGIDLRQQFSDTPSVNVSFERLEKAAYQYSQMCDKWFRLNRYVLVAQKVSADEREQTQHLLALTGAVEVINWYRFFIAAKIHRALNGLSLIEKNDLFVDEVQNDANGSAKIAILGIERCIASWEVIRSAFPEKTDELLDILVLLTRLRNSLKNIFPKVADFIRPGFDEINGVKATVMNG